jgi:hypothetical protein
MLLIIYSELQGDEWGLHIILASVTIVLVVVQLVLLVQKVLVWRRDR